MFYSLLKKLVGIFFNILNILLAGNLPPFGCVCVIVEDQDKYLWSFVLAKEFPDDNIGINSMRGIA